MSALARRGQARPRDQEAELVVRAQSGDAAAFEELARPHVDRLFGAVLRLIGDPVEAEDVLQETLLRAWRALARFRGRSAVSTWLYRIAINEANRSLKKGARRPATVELGEGQLRETPSLDDGPAQRAEHQQLREALRRGLLSLPPPYRTAIVLRDVEGLSTRESADIVGIGEAAFKSRLHQARLKLRAAVGDEALITAAT